MGRADSAIASQAKHPRRPLEEPSRPDHPGRAPDGRHSGNSVRLRKHFFVRFCFLLQISIDILPSICYTESMAKMGRPTKALKDRSSHLIALRLKPSEHKALEQAAAKAGLSVSDYIRSKLNLRGDK